MESSNWPWWVCRKLAISCSKPLPHLTWQCLLTMSVQQGCTTLPLVVVTRFASKLPYYRGLAGILSITCKSHVHRGAGILHRRFGNRVHKHRYHISACGRSPSRNTNALPFKLKAAKLEDCRACGGEKGHTELSSTYASVNIHGRRTGK